MSPGNKEVFLVSGSHDQDIRMPIYGENPSKIVNGPKSPYAMYFSNNVQNGGCEDK